jgi:hypothetical protein
MCKGIWERLDLPLSTDKVLIMESANNTRNATLRVVQNVPLFLGPVALILHIQVIEDAPFKVLLGRPFFALSSCLTEDNIEGSTYITIRDPNSGEIAKFPTHPTSGKRTPTIGV